MCRGNAQPVLKLPTNVCNLFRHHVANEANNSKHAAAANAAANHLANDRTEIETASCTSNTSQIGRAKCAQDCATKPTTNNTSNRIDLCALVQAANSFTGSITANNA